jgi:ADP-ribose pyrophosphatase YjhB (NUDIX family)
MELQVGVKILFKNKEGKFLLLRRSPKKYPEVGAKWDLVGGRIEPGTALLDNLKREVFEETKIVLMGEPKLIAAQDILGVPNRHVVRLTYIGETDENPLLGEEHDEYKWMAQEDLGALGESVDTYFKELLENGKVPF